MNWERVNIWTNTFYALIHSLGISKQIMFGNLSYLDQSILAAGAWIDPVCSYKSLLLEHPFGRNKPTFRRDPNKHFNEISAQVVKMLLQDLVVILDEMLSEAIEEQGEQPTTFPQSKVEKLSTHLEEKFAWSRCGCLEMIAARNVLTHGAGKWNQKSIAIVSTFLTEPPEIGDKLIIGFPMLFRYRKAMRTFLNEVTRVQRVSAIPVRKRKPPSK